MVKTQNVKWNISIDFYTRIIILKLGSISHCNSNMCNIFKIYVTNNMYTLIFMVIKSCYL